ncbi:MAG: hypothetical protein RMK29_07775 [Myxococcales bacterium]|nr:hypothetical protein [Myxococcota bacterium]MDW8281593.1 hypothetical protein [Myxococcales bacterium]
MFGPRTQSRIPRFWPVAAGLLGGAVWGALASGAGRGGGGDFAAILAEMRSGVAHTAELRAQAERGGDRVKSTCVYDALRGMMQAVSSAEVAQVAWESARARGDEAAAAAELERAQRALELLRRLRAQGDSCVGRELARPEVGTPGTTTVTVETTVRDDDPHAGPAESWAIRPPRLDLPGRAVPASPFRVGQ